MLQHRLGISQRRACRIVGQHRSTQRHAPQPADPARELRAKLRRFARDHPRWGYRRAHAVLVREGDCLNRKKVQRLWREEGLRVPSKRRKRARVGTSTTPADRLARPPGVDVAGHQGQSPNGRGPETALGIMPDRGSNSERAAPGPRHRRIRISGGRYIVL